MGRRQGRLADPAVRPGYKGHAPFGSISLRWYHAGMSDYEKAKDELRMLRQARKGSDGE